MDQWHIWLLPLKRQVDPHDHPALLERTIHHCYVGSSPYWEVPGCLCRIHHFQQFYFFGGGKRTTLNWTNIFRIFCWDPMPVKVDPDVRTSSPAVTQWSPIWMKHIAVTLHILCTGLSKNLRLSKQQIQEVCFMEVNVSPSSHSCLAFGTGASGENNSANKTWYTGSKIFSLWYNIYVCCRPASTDFTTTFSHPALWVCLFSSVKPASLPRPLAAQPYGLPRT